jgi:hypothetical protein
MPHQTQFAFGKKEPLLGRLSIGITREGINKIKDPKELTLLYGTFVRGVRAEDVIRTNATAWGISTKEAQGIYSRALVHLRQVTSNRSLRELAIRSKKESFPIKRKT